MTSFLQATGAQENENSDVRNQKPRVSLHIQVASGQEPNSMSSGEGGGSIVGDENTWQDRTGENKA